MKKEDKKRDYYLPIEDVWRKYPNKYEAILKIAKEANRLFEVTGERSDELILKAIEDIIIKEEAKDDKDSSGSDG